MYDTQRLKAEQNDRTLAIIRSNDSSVLHTKLMQMGDELQKTRLSELKANRKYKELSEREQYLGKLLKTREDEVNALAEKLAEEENKFNQASENWRIADNNRMAEFFSKFSQQPRQAS